MHVSRAMVVACAVHHNLCIKCRKEVEEVEEAAEVDSSGEDEASETVGSKSFLCHSTKVRME